MQGNFECDKSTGIKQGIASIIVVVLMILCVPFFGDVIREEVAQYNATNSIVEQEMALQMIVYLNCGMWALGVGGIFALVASVVSIIRFIQAIVYKCELPIASFVMGVLCLVAVPYMINIVKYIVLMFPLVA